MSKSPIVRIDGDDPELTLATEQARGTFKFFWRELSWEYRRIIPALGIAAVKMPFAVEDPMPGELAVEHMWITDIGFDGDRVKGVLLNEPQSVESVSQGDAAESPLSEIGDWMFECLGSVCGGYTVNHLRKTMSAGERRSHDRAWGLKFGDPEVIELVPDESEPRGFLGRLFGSKPVAETATDLERSEHPMSQNMEASIQEALVERPSLATEVDENGWTMLHRDALAGNLVPVKALVIHGAPLDLKTPSGDTAADLARKMAWPNLIDFFESQ